MSNVSGRILSVGTLCTGDNGKIKPNSSGIRGSPYSLVQAFPNVAPTLEIQSTIDMRYDEPAVNL